MNRQMTYALAGSIALLLCGSSFAATQSGLIDSSKLDDQNITDMQGQQLGELDGLLLDPATGSVQYALVELDDMRDGTDRSVPVPWSALKLNRDANGQVTLKLDATADKLAKAPRFSAAQANQLFTPEGADAVRSYWQLPMPGTASRQIAPPEPVAESPQTSQPPASSPGELENYYDVNRDILQPSAEPQNNSPDGILPEPPDRPQSSLPDQTQRAFDQVTDMDAPPQAPSNAPATEEPQSGVTIPE